MRYPTQCWIAAAALCAAPAMAQNGTSGANVTVQLPNFSVFGVNTTVLVPDSGPSPLAAQRQARYSRLLRRPMHPGHAIGAQRGAAAAAATAEIHDPQAADEALLLDARARRANWKRGSTSRFERRRTPPTGRGLQSIADIERQRHADSAAAHREALALAAKARRAAADGKPGVAGIYYNMALKKAAGPLEQDIRREARLLSQRAPGKNTAPHRPRATSATVPAAAAPAATTE